MLGLHTRSRASMVALAAVATLMAHPAAGQRMATGGAVVQVPPVSELNVEADGGEFEAGSRRVSGAIRVEVRTNQDWEVLVTASAEAGAVWVRAASEGGALQRLVPGTEVVIAAGPRGRAVVEIEYVVEGAPVSGGTPFHYTLSHR